MSGGAYVGNAAAGNGQTISLPTGPLVEDTSFVVRATKQSDPNIHVDLAGQTRVTVRPASAPVPVDRHLPIPTVNQIRDLAPLLHQALVTFVAFGFGAGSVWLTNNHQPTTVPTQPVVLSAPDDHHECNCVQCVARRTIRVRPPSTRCTVTRQQIDQAIAAVDQAISALNRAGRQ